MRRKWHTLSVFISNCRLICVKWQKPTIKFCIDVWKQLRRVTVQNTDNETFKTSGKLMKVKTINLLNDVYFLWTCGQTKNGIFVTWICVLISLLHWLIKIIVETKLNWNKIWLAFLSSSVKNVELYLFNLVIWVLGILTNFNVYSRSICLKGNVFWPVWLTWVGPLDRTSSSTTMLTLWWKLNQKVA